MDPLLLISQIKSLSQQELSPRLTRSSELDPSLWTLIERATREGYRAALRDVADLILREHEEHR